MRNRRQGEDETKSGNRRDIDKKQTGNGPEAKKKQEASEMQTVQDETQELCSYSDGK